MNIILKYWTNDDKTELIALCNAVDRTYLSDRLPNPYTNADADWWLNMVQLNEGKNGDPRFFNVLVHEPVERVHELITESCTKARNR